MSVADAIAKVVGKAQSSADDDAPASEGEEASAGSTDLADLAFDALKDDDREGWKTAFKAACRKYSKSTDEG